MDSSVKFPDSLMSCSACKIGKSTQKSHAKSASHDWVTEPLKVQVVTTVNGTYLCSCIGEL